MVRGLEQRAIFGDEDNRRDFVQRLGDACTRTGACVLAWALLPNHVHLLGWRRYGQLCGTAVLRRAPAGFGADRAQSPNGRYYYCVIKCPVPSIPHQGQFGSAGMIRRMWCHLIVVIEQGLWRSVRTGSAPRAETFG
jgi:hypothetical protein